MDRFRRMEIFVAVVEAGQFTRAAEALHLSKSAVSHGLADLEKYLGLQLLSRNNRFLQLTEAGQSYYEHCKRILADIQVVEDQVRSEDKHVTGHIRVTAPDTFGTYVLTPIIAHFMEDNPGVTIDLNLTERHVDLIEEGFDLAFRIQKTENSQMIYRKIFEARMMTCASPNYLEKSAPLTDHKDLKNHNCLRYIRSPTWHLTKNGRNFKIMPEGNLATNSGENLRQFMVAGQGVGHLPYFLVRHAIMKGRLVEVLKDYQGRTLNGYIVRPAHKHCPARVQRLIDYLAERVIGIQSLLANFNTPV